MGVEQAQKRLDKTYAILDGHFAKKRFVLGENFSMGDVSAAPALRIASMMRPFDEHKNLSAYFARLNERPSVQHAFKLLAEFLAHR
jgi:glutathione S-transferase